MGDRLAQAVPKGNPPKNMDEAKRFLRFVLPGLAAGVEFLLLIAISWTEPCLPTMLPQTQDLIALRILCMLREQLLWVLY